MLREAGLLEWLAEAPREFVTRFQQTTPPVMAKGVEDTAFYRYARLLASTTSAATRAASVDRRRRVPRRQRRARGALPAQPARSPRRTTPSARATCARGSARSPGWRRSGRRTCGAGASCARRCARRRARRGRGVHDLPDARGRLADRRRAPARLHGEGAARGQAQHELGRAGRRTGRSACSPTAARSTTTRRSAPDFEPFAERVAAAGELHALRQTALKLTVPGRARHLPGRRAGRALARRPRQPPAGRLGARRASCSRAARRAATSADARKLWLIRALLALRARRAGGVRGRLRPLDGRTPSRSCAAATSPSRCRSARGARAAAPPVAGGGGPARPPDPEPDDVASPAGGVQVVRRCTHPPLLCK